MTIAIDMSTQGLWWDNYVVLLLLLPVLIKLHVVSPYVLFEK